MHSSHKKSTRSNSVLFKNFNSDIAKELSEADKFLNRITNENVSSQFNIKEITNVNKKIEFDLEKEKIQFNKEDVLQRNDTDDSKKTNFLQIKDEILIKYKKQLKSFGFPEIGNFYFLPNEDEEKEKTLKFFDYIIMKKSNENEDKFKLKKQLDILGEKLSYCQSENIKLEKELISLRDETKKYLKEKQEAENKVNKIKESLEKQIAELKGINSKMSNKMNILGVEKKSFEEKYNKISELYQKIINKNNTGGTCINLKSNNNIEIIDTLKKNDLLKILTKVKGTEKLIETLKNGFNESLREILFEVSALKNFIFEVNKDLTSLIKIKNTFKPMNNFKFYEIEYNLLSMPFLNCVSKIKNIFKNNFNTLRKYLKLDIEDDSDIFYQEVLEGSINLNNNSLQDKEMTFEKDKFESINKNMYNNESTAGDKLSDVNYQELEEEQKENELEFFKNKWIKTLMKNVSLEDDL